MKAEAVTTRTLRLFTLRLGLFAVISGLIFWRREWWHGHWQPYFIWLGAWMVVVLPCLAFPEVARPLRAVLVQVGELIGRMLTWVALALTYFLVLTPLGLLARVFGKEFLSLRREPEAASFWTRRGRSADKASWERQF